MAFHDAVSRLNSGNSVELWTVAALLSTLEYFGAQPLDLFPALSFEDTRLFAEAILQSRASDSRHRIYSTNDLMYVLNNAKDGLLDSQLEGIKSGRERHVQLLEINKVFSRWGALQLEVQRSPASKAGRAIAFFELIPETLARASGAKSDLICEVMYQIREFLGCTATELVNVVFLVSAWYQNVFKRVLQLLDGVRIPRGAPPEKRAFAALQAILSNRQSFSDAVTFTVETLLRAAPFNLRPHVVEKVLSLWSRDTAELRGLLSEPAFKAGVDCWHLSPLHRFPIVCLPGDPLRYVVPNIRLLLQSIFPVLDYSLLESLPSDQYNAFRGAILEEYLFQLMSWAFPLSQLIREREYQVSKKELWRGPDVTFVDASTDTLIVVEAKTRRMRSDTRFQVEDELLDYNLADVHDALVKLPDKVAHLRIGLPAYEDIQPMIDTTRDTDPILVCVLPEAIFLLTRLERGRASFSGAHPLSGFGHPYCIMGLGDFEFAVACARHNSEALSTILHEFCEDSDSLELNSTASELFRGREVPSGRMFGEQFLRGIFDDSKEL